MKVIENSINMFKINYHDSAGIAHEWRLNTNWQYIVIGTVVLLAVILDQYGYLLKDQVRRQPMLLPQVVNSPSPASAANQKA